MSTVPVQFVVISHRRTGSHMLMNLLNSHPAVHCNSDLSSREVEQRGEAWAYAEGFKMPDGKVAQCQGFLVKIKQNLHHTMWKRPGLKAIFLQRRNQLATLLSIRVGRVLGCYESPGKGVSLDEAPARRAALPALPLDPKAARRFFKKCDEQGREVQKALKRVDHMEVWYEDLCSNAQPVMTRVFAHLGVSDHPIQHTEGRGAFKLDPRPLNVAISNYEEVKACFATTPWAEYFM